MQSLKTGGFAGLLSTVVAKARSGSHAAEVVRVALTLDARVTEKIGRNALTSADREVIELALRSHVQIDRDAGTGARLFLTATGRLTVRLDRTEAPDDLHLLGAPLWTDDEIEDVRTRWHSESVETAKALDALHAELVEKPLARIHEYIDRIEFAVVHMAPVLIYVNHRVYTNLGRASNLPGKSLSLGHEKSVLTGLRRTPPEQWSPEDACFVACLNVLLLSGPPVVVEEFNGAQLNPTTLQRFLVERTIGYGGEARPEQPAPSLAELEQRATACAALRQRVVAGGRLPYRFINGLTLHKREHLMTAPTLLGDLPAPIVDHLARSLGVELTAGTPIAGLDTAFTKLADRLAAAPAPAGFSSAFEAALHGYVTASAEAFAADVAMSRGPQAFGPLRAEPGTDPFDLGTGDFYCCVAPRQAFVDQFGEEREGLIRAVSAYSARMRFNTWHYLPHTLGIVEREPGRDDWFFAPTMPDVTDWSDQHHTGHVAFAVRFAIRVPFGIEFDGRPLPGLYDLRLMRTSLPPFTVDDLRQAVATAFVLRRFYQAMSVHEPRVVDFGKPWYERFHG